MRPWAHLDPRGREAFRATTAFLGKRLAEQETIDWALKLRPEQRIQRLAILELLDGLGARDLAEPWATAWRLIEESWSTGVPNRSDQLEIYGIQKRLRAGDRSGSVVAAITKLVAPSLRTEPIEDWRWEVIKKPRAPKTVDHVLSASLTSGSLIELNLLGLGALNDVAFLTSLANSLEAAVNYGLDIARRLGSDGSRSTLGLGLLNRVYYTQDTRRGGEGGEPDAYHRGIAPSVKLLHAVVGQISGSSPEAAQPFVRRWRAQASPVFIRLWAAMARSSRLVAADEVSSFLCASDDQQFWNLHAFPEVAELRAVRFAEFDRQSQSQITSRLRSGPPSNHWPKNAEKLKVASARRYWAVRELMRLAIAGSVLPARAKDWLDTHQADFPDLARMSINTGFPQGASARFVPPNPDWRFDDLEGATRLRELETALATTRAGWNDDPAGRANDWINQQGNTSKLIADFEAARGKGEEFPNVWSRFGWASVPLPEEARAAPGAQPSAEAARVLALLVKLSDATLATAIEGICAWLNSWERQVVRLPKALPLWLRLWPLAVEATNGTEDEVEDSALLVIPHADGDECEPEDLDTLNSTVGKLVGVFLTACPSLPSGSQAFVEGSTERRMRDVVITGEGRSGLVARHRLIEGLPYFLRADRP